MFRKSRVISTVSLCAALSLVAAACSSGDSGDDGPTTIEFAQWWGTELPDGELESIISDFEDETGIQVEITSQPYSTVKDQLVAGAVSGTMPDVMGLDGNWVYDFNKQGALADMRPLAEDAGFDDWDKVNPIEMDDKVEMIPVANFAYPLFINTDLFEKAGIDSPPKTWDEFATAAKKISELGEETYGWVLPLSLQSSVGVKNDVLSWLWASGGSMLTDDGQPNLTSDQMHDVVSFINDMNSDGAIAPGIASLQEQDKVEEFANGRVGMMIDTLAHINLLSDHKDLNFEVVGQPVQEGFTGTSGVTFASWGIGVAENSEHQEAAWKLVQYLLSKDVNTKLADMAHAFPGNSDAKPESVNDDKRIAAAYEVWNNGTPSDEFIGLPTSEELMRSLDQQVQAILSGDTSIDQGLADAQKQWEDVFANN